MNKRISGLVLLSLAAAALMPVRARAAGAFLYSHTGTPYTWNTAFPILYDVDPGPLGTMSHDKALAMVNSMVQQWSGVKTAKIAFELAGPADTTFTGDFKHVTAANVDNYLAGLPTDITPVIFDTDGGVMDHLLGAGTSVDALAVAYYPSGAISGQDTGKPTIGQAVLILNGRAMDGQPSPDDVSEADMTRATARAIGEMLNLAATDLNDELILDGNPANNVTVPIMHAGTTINGELVHIINGGSALTVEDQISISTLYPAAALAANTGVIAGTVTAADGTTGIQNIDVIARSVDDPTNTAVSAISGEKYLGSGGGSPDPALRGAFEIHVPPGNYTLEFRPLRQPIGPLQEIFPLPGGRQFYQASSPTAGPPSPVTVTAGQTTQVKLVASGKAAPAAQAVDAVKTPHSSTQTAQLIPLSATVSGHVAPSPAGTPGQIVFDYVEGQDKLEDLYRIVVPEASIITLRLEQKDKVDLDLYLLDGFPGGSRPSVVGASTTGGTDPEAVQAAVGPGTYFVGVTAWDVVQHPAATDYTLSVTTTPLGDQTPPTRPVLNQFVLGNITDTGADVSWLTDVGAGTEVIAGSPRQEFGDPGPTMLHHVTLSGLAAGGYTDVIAVSQDAKGERDTIPRVFFRTADTAAATGPAKLQTEVLGATDDFVGGGLTDQRTTLVEVAIQNSGGSASSVQITGLTPSTGWKLAQPITQPLVIGNIGTGGTAIVVVRLVRDGSATGTPPLPSVTGTGTLAGAGGAAASFTIGP